MMASCSQFDANYDKLVGSWKLDVTLDSTGMERNSFFLSKPGIEFISTSQFRYLPGPINLSQEEQPELKELIDTIINCNISNKQITYQALRGNKVITKNILHLSSDSLYILDKKKNLHKYSRINKDTSNQKNITKIVLSSSGCYGLCPIVDIEINKSQKASFYCSEYCGNYGFHSGEIPKTKINRLFQLLSYINIDTLQDTYYASHTDDETITVSFYNKNKLLKTVSDYGRKAPTEFIWLYTYLRYMPKLKSLTPKNEPIIPLKKPRCYTFLNGTKNYSLERPESYMLFTQLLNAQVVDIEIDLPFNIYNLDFPFKEFKAFINDYEMPKAIGETDGRFFRFKSMNNQIIDLGYNYFIEK